MTESTIYNRTLAQGEARGRLQVNRAHLIALLGSKYPGEVPEDYLNIIRHQESVAMLEAWFQAALDAKTVTDFLNEMRR